MAKLLSSQVKVKDGSYSFSLESVKVLKRLMEAQAREMEVKALASPRFDPFHHTTPGAQLCNNPTLPQEMKAVCMEPQCHDLFVRFVALITPSSDPCEICVSPACTGCY
ncbi:guanylin-like [Engraulis encrasicolus]|uniref:guanylin-like n=1 Tax=Engraulis encrasicolus TaxID=184585 RepID=UPI002FD0E625